MKAHGNGTPETCAANLLRIVRGEVAFDRVRGIDGALVDQPNTTDDAAADAEWTLSTYEPRLNISSVENIIENAKTGNFAIVANVERKEDEE